MAHRWTLDGPQWRRYGQDGVTIPDPPAYTPPPGPVAAGAATPGAGPAYPVPAGSVFVAPGGNDTTGNGTVNAPYATLTKANSVAAAGGTIVLRGGVYLEGTTTAASLGVVLNKADLAVVNFPGETVWLDGSLPQTGWVADAGKWRKDYVASFDRSPTYTRGGLDGTQAGWQFVNSSFPCAPWPEQVFIDGVPQAQVATLGEVTAGKFYVAGTASGSNNMTFTSSAYYIGTDPTGKEVRIGSKVAAVTCLATGIQLKGIGIRRYSNSVPDFGAVKLYRDGCGMEHVHMEDIATTGVWLDGNHGATLKNVTLTRCGLVGGGANKSDHTTLDSCRFTFNTSGRFNSAPVSGGWKAAHCQYYTVKDSVISDNYQHGLWFDETVYQMDVSGCDIQRNGGYGGIAEISEGARFVNCLVTGNARGGLLVQGTNNSQVWNCTLADNGASSFKLIQDPRRPADGSALDTRFPQSWYDANCTWVISSFTFSNNVSDDPGNQSLSTETGYGFYVLSQEAPKRGWQAFGIAADGNLYSRTVSNVPVNMFLLAQTGANAAGYSTFPPYKSLVAPRESQSVELRGSDALTAAFLPTSAAAAATVDTPIPLPAGIAELIGVPTGTRHLGVWR